MQNYILFDDKSRDNLLPLTFTRPVAEIRVGILTNKERFDKILNTSCSYLTQDYLSKKFTLKTSDDNILINASIVINQALAKEINALEFNQTLLKEDVIIATRLKDDISNFANKSADAEQIIAQSEFQKINYPWDIFSLNGVVLEADFQLITKGRKSQEASKTNQILGNNIFIEEGAKLECTTLNTETGSIYIGKDAEVMEGAVIRGPFALCEHSTIKLGGKVYGPTTIGPHSKVGGEINNSVIFGFSNKGHDGFLGNSVLGEWCNIGADSNNSNLKNNYAEVRVWNYVKESFVKTGLQFCGLIMGDHSKCGINTMFNTGTVVGVNANIFGSGFPRNFIPSFSWGGASGQTTYTTKKAFEVNEIVMSRRDIPFDDIEKNILIHIFEQSQKYRKF